MKSAPNFHFEYRTSVFFFTRLRHASRDGLCDEQREETYTTKIGGLFKIFNAIPYELTLHYYTNSNFGTNCGEFEHC